jgi:glycosyltransferase involved in cell wall biosynthesis
MPSFDSPLAKPPVVSVVMSAYNHASFVVDAITSVLSQDFGDLELLFADDGSQDATADIARSVQDPRMTLFIHHRVNRGAALVMNELIQRATGKYVAIINSDDVWMPGKIAAQVDFLESNPDIVACFGHVQFIGPDSKFIPKEQTDGLAAVFDVANRSRGAWLRHFFAWGNCLCHPTLLIKRAAYTELGLYDNRLRQLPDFDMWIRLVKRYAFHILDRKMIQFRLLPGQNASISSRGNLIRSANELYFITRQFFSETSKELLQEGFGDLLKKPDIPSDIHLDIEKALLFFAPCGEFRAKSHTVIGLTLLHEFLASPRHREVMLNAYALNDQAFHRLSGEIETFLPR